MTRKLNFIPVLVPLVVTLSLVVACATQAPASPTPGKPAPAAPPAAAWPKSTVMTTVPVGGTLNVYGVAAAAIIEKYTKVIVSPQATGGGKEPILLLTRGEAGFAAAAFIELIAAYMGDEPYKKEDAGIVRQITGALSSHANFGVRADSKINTIADLKGKRCMFSRIGQEAYEQGYRVVLKAYGLTEKDITVMPTLGFKESTQALIEGTADAFLQYSAPPNPTFIEMDRAVPLRILPIEGDKQAQILKELRWAYAGVIPGGIYKGTPKDAPTIVTASGVSVSTKMPDDFVYQAAKALIEHIDELQAVNVAFKSWTPQDLVANPQIPYHAGAFKYFQEKGLITPEWDKKHKELLASRNQKS